MTKKQVGSAVWESRGDDFYIVSATPDGDVVEVQQYDSLGHRYEAINFFAETAPKLVKLIEKAGGIKVEEPEKPEYEYAIQTEDLWAKPYVIGRHWGGTGEYWGSREDRQTELDWYHSEFDPSSYWLVKRRKAGPVEKVGD